MTVTIANGSLSIAHQGSNGVAAATVPDVCKTPTPGGPVPTPYRMSPCRAACRAVQ